MCSASADRWYIYGEPLSHFVGTPVHGSCPGAAPGPASARRGEMLRQMVGDFGWLDTRAPGVTFFIWVVAIGGVAALTLAIASSRFVWALLAATAATVVLPVIVEAAGAQEAGFIWQGRYTLPLAVGIPIIAGIGIGSAEGAARLSRRLAYVHRREPRGRTIPRVRPGAAALLRRARTATVVLLRRALEPAGAVAAPRRRICRGHRAHDVVDRAGTDRVAPT